MIVGSRMKERHCACILHIYVRKEGVCTVVGCVSDFEDACSLVQLLISVHRFTCGNELPFVPSSVDAFP